MSPALLMSLESNCHDSSHISFGFAALVRLFTDWPLCVCVCLLSSSRSLSLSLSLSLFLPLSGQHIVKEGSSVGSRPSTRKSGTLSGAERTGYNPRYIRVEAQNGSAAAIREIPATLASLLADPRMSRRSLFSIKKHCLIQARTPV